MADKKSVFKKPENFGEVMDLVGNILAWSVLLIYFVGLPFYFKNGYESIASNKYLYIMYTGKYVAIVAGILLLIRMCLWGYSKEEISIYKGMLRTDIFMLAFIMLAVLSHFCSAHKTGGEHYLTDWFYESSLWGTRGWYMGLVSYLVFFMLYLVVSRALIFSNRIYIPILATAIIICAWGILNRYCIAPVDMSYDYSEGVFLASLGNINWFCGYTSVLIPLLWGLYLGVKKIWVKVILWISCFISFYMILVNSSNSGIFALIVTMIVLLAYCMTDYNKFRSFLELAGAMLLSGGLIDVLDMIFWDQRTGRDGMIEPFFGYFSLALLALDVVVCFLISKKKENYPVKLFAKLRKILIIVILSLFGLFVSLVTINTITKGALPIIGDKSIFMFEGEWGSGRAYTWTFGLKTFGHMNFGHKLIGSGPDTFFYEMISYSDLNDEWYAVYNGARLTNAHNEWISLLVNNGLLGLGAFIGFLYTGVKNSFKMAGENPSYIAFALAIISYTANNMFSFQQVTNTPFLFLVLGLEGAAMADIARPLVALTKKSRKNTIQKGKNKRK